MALLTQKTKFINIVVRKLDINISERDKYIKQWCDANCEFYCYIYHRFDKNIEGMTEHEHLHLVATLKTSQRLSTTLNSFCDGVSLTTLGVMIDKCNSYEGSIQYLIHKNDPQKTQHSIDEVISNYDKEELNTLMDYEFVSLTPQRLRYIVKTANSNYEIIEQLGIEKYTRYRRVIQDIKEDMRIWNY